jgi:YD repeat-containing protein
MSFTIHLLDQTAEYIPPDVGAGATRTVYTYNLDKDLTSITRPDGQVFSVDYDNAGRLSELRLAPTNQTLASYASSTAALPIPIPPMASC